MNHYQQQIFMYRTRTPNSITTVITPIGFVPTKPGPGTSTAFSGIKAALRRAKPNLGSRVHKVRVNRGARAAASHQFFPSSQSSIRQPPVNYGYSSGPAPFDSPALPPVNYGYTSCQQAPQMCGVPQLPYSYGYSTRPSPPNSANSRDPRINRREKVGKKAASNTLESQSSGRVDVSKNLVELQLDAVVPRSPGSTDFWRMVSNTNKIPCLESPVKVQSMYLNDSADDDLLVVEPEEMPAKDPILIRDEDDDDVVIQDVPVEQITVEDEDTDDELTELRAERNERATIDIAAVKVKQEPIDPDYDFEPIVDNVYQSTTQAANVTVSSGLDGNVQMKPATSVPKAGIRITVLKPPPPAVIRRPPIVSVQEEEEKPQFPEQPDFAVKPSLRGVRFANQHPVQKGHDASGLCSIM